MIATSLVVFFVPNFVGFGVWFVSGELPTLLRSLTAIMSWVAAFGLSSALFWRIIRSKFAVVSP